VFVQWVSYIGLPLTNIHALTVFDQPVCPLGLSLTTSPGSSVVLPGNCLNLPNQRVLLPKDTKNPSGLP
jgi:hypothetical protein